MKIQILFMFLLFLAFFVAEAKNEKKAKILQIMPFIAYSHVKFHGQLADILVRDGYDVHLAIHELRPITADGSALAKIIKFHTSVSKHENAQNPIKAVFQNKTAYDDQACRMFWRSMGDVCKEVLQNETYKAMLKAENFDLGIGAEPCAFVLFKELGIKAQIIAGPMPLMDDIEYVHGIPIQRSYNNFVFNGYINAPYLTFKQRLEATLEILTKYIGYGSPTNWEMQKILDDTFGKGKYNIEEAMQDVSLIFSNSHELIDIARPTISKVIPIGGLGMVPPKPLTEDIENIIKNSKNGIVLFTFGSQVDLSMLPEDLKLNIFNAFAKFPEIEFLIKYTLNQSETYDIVNNYQNIHPFQWLDQASILCHPRLLTFITHGGRNSLAEAITAGVPTISIPLFADQFYNSAIYGYRKIGIPMQLQELSEDKIIKALKKVVYENEMRQNAQIIKEKLLASPFSSQDRFLKYVEFIAKFKEFPEYNLPGAKMSFFYVYNLDIVAFLFILTFAALVITFYAINTAINFSSGDSIKPMNQQKIKSN